MDTNPMAYTMDCTNEQCQDTIIDCLPNQDCDILCTESKSCYHTTINCPINSGNCNIHCRGGESCRESIINATLSSGNFNLLCEESTDHCRDITIYGSILNDTNIGNYSIICDGNTRACANANIECPLNSDCSISCLSDTSCRWAQINGPINGNLHIECEGIKSCFDAILDGKKSSTLDITGCSSQESCFDLSLYCPPNSNGVPNCFIEGNNNIGRDNAKGTKIYATNGWNDINIDYNGTFSAFHDGIMLCGEDYGIRCDIASDNWACINYNDYCNFNPTTPPSPTNTPQPSSKLNNTIFSIKTTHDDNIIYINNTNHTETETETDLINNTSNNSSLVIKIVISIAVVSTICGIIICIKMLQKWFVRNLKKEQKKHCDEGEDSDLYGFVLKVTGSDQRDFISELEGPDLDEFDVYDEPGRNNNNIDSKYKIKESNADPLDVSYNLTAALQPQRSVTDNTFLSAPISELDSPNCIPVGHIFSTDLSKYNGGSRKVSDISLGGVGNEYNTIHYDHNAPIQETKQFITPKPPPRNTKYCSNDMSISSKKSSFSHSEGMSSVHTSQTTQESIHDEDSIMKRDNKTRDSFSDIYDQISRKPTTEL